MTWQIDFTVFKFIWSLLYRIWNEYANILAAEFDVSKGSSIEYIRQFLQKTKIVYPLKPTSLFVYQGVLNANCSEDQIPYQISMIQQHWVQTKLLSYKGSY